MSKHQRHRAKRTPDSPNVSKGRIDELTGLTLEAMQATALCCCHMDDRGHPCPRHAWAAWQVFLVARDGAFPKIVRIDGKSKLLLFPFAVNTFHNWGLLGMPASIGFRNAGSKRMVRPSVSLVPFPTKATIRRAGEAARQQHTLQQLKTLITSCVDEAITRHPAIYAPVLANDDNVALLESLGGFSAIRFRLRPA